MRAFSKTLELTLILAQNFPPHLKSNQVQLDILLQFRTFYNNCMFYYKC